MVCNHDVESRVLQVQRYHGFTELRERRVSSCQVEGVPVMSFPHCGESYLTVHTLHEIERIKRQREGVATKRLW